MTGTTTEDVEKLALDQIKRAHSCRMGGFEPEADAALVLAATLRALAAERDAAMTLAINLARALHADHYAEIAPNWEPLDYCAGVISQIDNMVAGIVAERDALAARVERLEETLHSIAANSCCEYCREAGLWAKAALEGSHE